MNHYQLKLYNESCKKDPLVKELFEKGFTYSQISKEVGVGVDSIRKSTKRQGLIKFRRESTESYKETIRRLRDEGHLVTEIADILGKDPATIREHLRKMGYNTYDRFLIKNTENQYVIKLYLEGFSAKEISLKTGYSITKVKNCFKSNGFVDIKKCTKCGKTTEKRHCLDCKSLRIKQKLNRRPCNFNELIENKVKYIRNSSKKRGLEFNLDVEYLNKVWDKQQGRCVLTNELFQINNRNKKTKVSLDRFDNSLGYIQGNVFFVSYWINERKGDFSIEELKEYMPIVYKRGLAFLKTLL